jgi:UDP-glucuronate decarboxylase
MIHPDLESGRRTRPARVIVTGASGFIGTHAMRILAERAVDVHVSCVDLLQDLAGFRELVTRLQPTHLLHLAWYAVPGAFYSALENYAWPGATIAAVQAFAEAGGTRVVIAGTCAEYHAHSGFLSEDSTLLAPTTPYGVAKDAARRLVESYARQVNLSTAWARLFFIYGPGEHSDRLVPSVIRSLLAGQEARSTEGRQIRDFVHVADAANALVATLLSDVAGSINVSSGEPVSVRDVVQTIGEELHATHLLRIGTLPSQGEAPMIVGDNRRLREELGWQPRFDLRSGIADTISWWRTTNGG